MGTKIASLEIELGMPTGSAIAEMRAFGGAVGTVSEKVVQDAGRMSGAVRAVGDMTSAGASIEKFAGSMERTTLQTIREAERSERAGERMVAQMERQIAVYGLTKAEVRALRAEEAARAADQSNQAELAGRIRAREAELYALEFAAIRKARQEAEDAGQAAAAGQDAAALARLREMIDPAAAAQNRLNAELAEARRVMKAAGASANELAAAEDALWARSQRSVQQHDAVAGAAKRSSGALQSVALQLPDITQGLLTGQPPMQVFIQQGGQLLQVAQMAEGGVRGFGRELLGLAVAFSPLLIGLAAAGAGFALFNRWVNEGVSSDQLTRNLGDITGGADATKQELYKLKDASVSFASTAEALFSVLGKDIAEYFVGDMAGMGKDVKNILDDLTAYGRAALAGLYAGVAGFKAYMGEVSSRGGLWNALTGDPELMDRTFGKSYRDVDKYLGDLGKRVRREAISIEREKLADKIGFNNTPKPKVDRHAEQLARDAAAMEAQISGLYRIAEAYGVSGAAALIAEAEVRAQTAAIKKEGEVREFVDRQIRLSIAERVKGTAASAAGMRDQATVQAEVNGQVAAGLIPAARADELVQRRIAALPILAAQEAAQQRGLTKEVEAATKALADQEAAQAAVDAAAIGKRFVADDAAGDRRLAELRLEGELIGANDMARVKALATLRATNEAVDKNYNGAYAADYIAKQVEIAVQIERNAAAQREWNDALTFTADQWDLIARNVQEAARGMAEAFGDVGRAIGDMAAIYAGYRSEQERERNVHTDRLALASQIENASRRATAEDRENRRHALATATQQIGLYGDMASAARGFFKEGSDGYKGLTTAIQVFRAIEFALSIRAMAQDAVETASSLAKSAARAVAHGVEAVAKAIASLPYPANIAAGVATAAALAAIGVSIVGAISGGGSKAESANEGRGTVLGDPTAQSESLRRGIDALKEVDTLMLTSSRQMAGYLRSIDSQIGGFAAQIVRSGDVNASAGVTEGFKKDMIGSIVGAIPLIGGFLGSLFGSKTTITGSGLYGGAQSVGDILAGGYDAQTYSDVTKTKKFLGVTTGKKTSTQYAAADDGLENQFTLILRGFASAINAAAGPLGEATDAVQARLNGFVVDIGKVDLKGLTGEQIQEKLEAIFGAAADGMAEAAFPGIARFQAAGEGMFETLVRVSSTVEQVTASFEMLGRGGIGIDASVELAGLFDSVSDLATAQQAYFDAFYDEAEQATARRAQLERALGSLGVKMPATLASFRALVEAQDLASAAGRETYATLIQLAPAFADLQAAMGGAKSAADIAAERQDLERKLLELNGDQAAIRALDLAKLDASNRGLQEQVWAAEAAKEAAAKAEELRKAWSNVGDGLQEEIRRIRGLDAAQGPAGFSAIMGQFNAVTSAARAGDMDAAKQLPGLSRSLLDVASKAASSRQELDRVQAEAAASLEATYAAIAGYGTENAVADTATRTAEAMAQAATSAASTASSTAGLLAAMQKMGDELAALRNESRAGHAKTADEASRSAKVLERASGATGGVALATRAA